jgi:hypothetical protein
MELSAFLETVGRRRKSVVEYLRPADATTEQFQFRNATVEQRPLPPGVPDSFLVVRSDDEFEGAISLSDFQQFRAPPLRDIWNLQARDTGYRAVVELLDDAVFAGLDRRQLLATSREFEDRAWRVGTGTIHAGFQRLDAYRAQRPLYDRLAEETNLDVHVYAVVEDPPDDIAPGVTLHTEPTAEIGRYWFVVYDGGDAVDQQCALVAEQTDDGSYDGAWTYDRSLVDSLLASLG